MIIHPVASAADMTDVLLWDAIEKEWRIGHKRTLYVGEAFWCACTVEEADDLVEIGEPVPVFTEVSHWAALPMPIEE